MNATGALLRRGLNLPILIRPGRVRSLVSKLNVADQRRMILLALIHLPLAVLMVHLPVVATIHACLVFGLGVWWMISQHRPERVACVAAYIAGGEVLWRMARAEIFWEFGKYAVAGLLGIGLLRYFQRWRNAVLPVGYFALLLPAVPLTIGALGFSGLARSRLSFDLSGPLALAVAVLFFSQLQATARTIKLLFWSVLAPTCGIAAFVLYHILLAQSLAFSNESNFTTSGGFGPNQVSSSLGLGALLSLMLALQEERRSKRFWISLILMLWMSIQAALTFSRGGIYSAALATFIATIHYLRIPRARAALFTLAATGLLIGGFFVIPWLNSFTEGMLEKRFSNTDSTHRDEIALADLQVWMESPLLGVGPGMARDERRTLGYFGHQIAAHTELTRLLSEHGTPGLLALVALVLMIAQAYRRAGGLAARAHVAVLTAWSLSEMMHAGMRVAAISFVFGLAMCRREISRGAGHRLLGGAFRASNKVDMVANRSGELP